jgi:monoamine oxidase
VITRRTFVGGAAAGVAGVAISEAEALARKRPPRRRSKTIDVVVVGAGLSGLIAAREMMRAGRSVQVVEARDRVGGRILNHPIGGGKIVEAGAEFVGPTQDHVLALIKELGLSMFAPYDQGMNVFYNNGQRTTYSDTGVTGTAPPDPLLLPDIASAVAQLDSLSTSVPVDAPWTAPNAGMWDRMTFDDWLRQHEVNPNFFNLVLALVEPVFGTAPDEVSMLYTLFVIAAAGTEGTPGTVERMLNVRGGAQQDRILGGTGLIPMGVAKQLGARVIKGSPVRQIVQSSAGVTVVSSRATVRAKRAIVALAPSLCQMIDFQPLLPSLRSELQQRMPIGTLMKVDAVYDRPFWRDAGLNGQMVSTVGPVRYGVDNSPPDGSPGVLMGFVGGNELRRLAGVSPAVRRQVVLESFARGFGPQALRPRAYFELNWSNERYTRGCPVGLCTPGTLTEVGAALREPVGHIHWAGTETAAHWNGYMDGAVRAGKRAAKEVLSEL